MKWRRPVPAPPVPTIVPASSHNRPFGARVARAELCSSNRRDRRIKHDQRFTTRGELQDLFENGPTPARPWRSDVILGADAVTSKPVASVREIAIRRGLRPGAQRADAAGDYARLQATLAIEWASVIMERSSRKSRFNSPRAISALNECV